GGVFHQPRPAGAEAGHAGRRQLLFKLGETAERAVDGVRQFSGWLAAPFGAHDLPEHRVIDVAAAVVADGGSDVLGDDGAVIGQQFFYAFVSQLRSRV